MTWQKRVTEAVDEWATQGRTEEQIYAVNNFLTGRGLKLLEEVEREAKRETDENWKTAIQYNCEPEQVGRILGAYSALTNKDL